MKVAEGLSISTKQKKAQQKYLIVIVQNQGWLLALDCLTVWYKLLAGNSNE